MRSNIHGAKRAILAMTAGMRMTQGLLRRVKRCTIRINGTASSSAASDQVAPLTVLSTSVRFLYTPRRVGGDWNNPGDWTETAHITPAYRRTLKARGG